MKRRRLIAAAAVAVGLSVAVAVQAATGAGKLSAAIGPGFSIGLTKGGKKVTSLKAGSYTIVVNDKGTIHNFHLKGPGLNKATGVGATGVVTWNAKLKKGTYRFLCDVHPSALRGSFKVT